MLYLVASHGSLALHSPYAHPRQGQGNEREWGPALFMISIHEHFEKEFSQNFTNLKSSHR